MPLIEGKQVLVVVALLWLVLMLLVVSLIPAPAGAVEKAARNVEQHAKDSDDSKNERAA